MTDRDIQRRVQDSFDRDPVLAAAAIGVAVRQGVVTLHGQVDTLQERWTAERIAQQLPDVQAVANDLEVLSARRVPRTDAAIARAIANALSWQVAVSADAILASVRDGWVSLSGTVPTLEQKRIAERVVRLLYGVKGVFSTIAVAASENVAKTVPIPAA
jgi:osmotically-inducible protein OsmY